MALSECDLQGILSGKWSVESNWNDWLRNVTCKTEFYEFLNLLWLHGTNFLMTLCHTVSITQWTLTFTVTARSAVQHSQTQSVNWSYNLHLFVPLVEMCKILVGHRFALCKQLFFCANENGCFVQEILQSLWDLVWLMKVGIVWRTGAHVMHWRPKQALCCKKTHQPCWILGSLGLQIFWGWHGHVLPFQWNLMQRTRKHSQRVILGLSWCST